eukprot:46108-Eustigmatos_ZCMA.PRE.1
MQIDTDARPNAQCLAAWPAFPPRPSNPTTTTSATTTSLPFCHSTHTSSPLRPSPPATHIRALSLLLITWCPHRRREEATLHSVPQQSALARMGSHKSHRRRWRWRLGRK